MKQKRIKFIMTTKIVAVEYMEGVEGIDSLLLSCSVVISATLETRQNSDDLSPGHD